jgi:thioredoxin reductase
VVIESEGLTIGRLSGNDLVLNHRAVDATHAGIKEIEGEHWIFNLSNAHGIVVNRRLFDQALLADGDLAQFGPYLLRIEKSSDGLVITVEVEVGSQLSEGRAGMPETPRHTDFSASASGHIDEQALNVFWDKRKRESGKIIEKTLLHPKGKQRIGKALSNWMPTLDLREPWRKSYFIWGGIIVSAFSLTALLAHRQAFSPGEIASAHQSLTPSARGIAVRASNSCSDCHGVTTTIESKCATCHQTSSFQPTISDAHLREEIGCVGCHSEHQGRRAETGLLNPNVCVHCHNDSYRIQTGDRAGRLLGAAHGGEAGYPIVDGKWEWKGLAAGEWSRRGLPALLATRPADEQFHAIHRTIYVFGESHRRMECRTCHTAGIPQAGERDLSPRNACATCHAAQSSASAINCMTCHLQHGRSKDLTALLAGVAGDFQRLKEQASLGLAERKMNESRASLQAPSHGRGGANVYRQDQMALSWESAWLRFGALPWYGWLGLMAMLPLSGVAALAFYTLREKRLLKRMRIEPGGSGSEKAAISSQDAARLKAEEMLYPHPVIDPLLCIGCHACVEACPHDVLDIVNGVATPVALDQCMEDTSCMVECPTSPKACVVVNTQKIIPPRKVPQRNQSLMTNVHGIYLIGDVSGVPLIKNAINEGAQVIERIIEDLNQETEGSEAEYDVAIIGLGPAGLSAAVTAQERGLKCLALEQNKVASTIRNFPAGKYVFFKPDTVEAKGGIPLQGAGGLKEETLQAWLNVVMARGLEIREEESCKNLQHGLGFFTVLTEKGGGQEKHSYRARKVVLAIGNHGAPMRLKVPGEDLKITLQSGVAEDKVKYKLSDPDAYVNKKCIVVGAGNSAIEAAVALTGFKREGDQITFTRENEVTLVVRSDFKGDLKLGNKMDVYDCLDAGRLKVFFRTEIKEMSEREVVLMDVKTKTEQARLPNDYVFSLIGSEKPTRFLESLGIKVG